MNTYFKEKQDGRFVHYESSFYDRNYEETISDVESRMYAKPYEVEEYLNNNPKKPYILFYYCEHLPKKIKKQIFSYAKEHGYAVYGAGECDKQYTDITVDLAPFEWVEMFRNADFVFTGTFHGAVFSILNERPFKVYLTNESRIKKVGALLRELHIPNRKIDKNFKFDLEKMRNEIDYDVVNKIIDEKREASIEYLRQVIKEN